MLNMDFSQRVVIDTRAMSWQASPMAGVWRKPLAREEAERGHATSIVRYDPGASFRRHDHPAGEEILVLDGTFSDETGDFGAGTYFRNPPGFRHAPFSRQGCLILVKLHQFAAGDTARISLQTGDAPFTQTQGAVRRLPLHQYGSEQVALLSWPAGERFPALGDDAGLELYVLRGEICDDLGVYSAGTWLRQPRGSYRDTRANRDSLLWVKTGHLP